MVRILLKNGSNREILSETPSGSAVVFRKMIYGRIRSVIKSIFSKNENTDVVVVPTAIDFSFHRAIAPTLIATQCFGLLPVSGVLGPSANSLSFSWLSLRVVYCLMGLIYKLVMIILTIMQLSQTKISFVNTGGIVFFGSGMLTCILFINIARQWPMLAIKWARIDKDMGPPPGTPLRKRINKITTVILFLSLVEHFMHLFNKAAYVLVCFSDRDTTREFFFSAFNQFFFYIEYALWKGLMLEFFNLATTLAWNTMDLFIIVISVALTQRFEHINYKLNAVRGKMMPESFWILAREEYTRLTDLSSTVDDVMQHLVMLSFANNLYFIAQQLLNSLGPPFQDLILSMYFWYSLIFLLLRTMAVCLFAARIREEGQGPLYVLRAVPSSGYGTEVQRFIDHVGIGGVGLTGMKFFSITRGLILTVAGTIVTYELVLVQFNDSTGGSDRKSLCS